MFKINPGKRRDLIPLQVLYREAIHFIFKKDDFTFANGREELLRKSVAAWGEFLLQEKEKKYSKTKDKSIFEGEVGKKGTPIDELESKIGMLCLLIRKNDQGHFDKLRWTAKLHNLDYRKLPQFRKWFPDAYKPADFSKAKLAYENLKALKPEENN